MDKHTVVRTTQALGITTSLLMSGMNFISSFLVITPLYPLPINESTRIFSVLYKEGAKVLVPMILGSAGLNGLAAYLTPDSRTEFSIAAVAAFAPAALTQLVMMAGIQRLLRIQSMDGSTIQGVSKQEVINLLAAWKSQNYIRALLGLVAGVAGLFGALKHV